MFMSYKRQRWNVFLVFCLQSFVMSKCGEGCNACLNISENRNEHMNLFMVELKLDESIDDNVLESCVICDELE